MTAHPLYLEALRADEALSIHLSKLGVTRWNMKPSDYSKPGVRDAFSAKYVADAAWLEHLREDSEIRTAVKGVL